MNKPVGAGRADGLFVEAHRVNIAALEASDLGADQRGAVLEILRAIRRPDLELPVMCGDSVQVPWPLVGCRGIAGGGLRQRAVEVIFRRFELRNRGPQQPVCSRRGLDGRRIVARKEARLQLADPVPELGTRQIRVAGQMALHPRLIKLRIVKAAELRRQSPECPDQPELRGDEVDDKPEPRLLREREAMLGFAFRLGKRIARHEKVRVHLVAAVAGVNEVAARVCRLERAAQQIAASPDMPRPGQDAIGKVHIGPGLETRQSASSTRS